MIDKSKQLTIAIALSVVSLLAWNFTDFVSTGQMIAAQILSIGGFTVFRLIQNNKLDDFKSKFEQENKAATIDKSELRRILDKWSEDEFRGNLQVDWLFADRTAKPMYEEGEKVDEYICVTGAVANKSTSLQVFVLASEGKVKENMIVRSKDMYVYPFKYSEYWQEYKRQGKYRSMKNADAQNIQITPGMMQATPQQQNNQSNNGGDDE